MIVILEIQLRFLFDTDFYFMLQVLYPSRFLTLRGVAFPNKSRENDYLAPKCDINKRQYFDF